MSKSSNLFTTTERAEIEAAIAEAEKKTSGELVVCIADRSGRYDRGEDLAGVVFGLVAVAAVWLPFQGVVEADWGHAPALGLLAVLLLFLGGFVVGAVAATWFAPLGLLFTRRSEMRAEVKSRAALAFYAEGVHGTRRATGVLIYVSLLERIVWVVGDDAIDEKIPQGSWDEMRDAIVAGFRAKTPAAGLVDAIGQAGALLAEHVPGSRDDVDELDNSIRYLEGRARLRASGDHTTTSSRRAK